MIDQAAITDIFKIQIKTGKRARWYLTSADYDVISKYIPGKSNTVADALSRYIPDHVNTVVYNICLDEESIKLHQHNDSEFKQIIDYLRSENRNPNMKFIISIEDLRIINGLLVRDTVLSQKDMPKEKTT